MDNTIVNPEETVNTSNEQLGVITAVRYGLNDTQVGMVYGIKFLKGNTVLFMPADAVADLIQKHQIADIHALQSVPIVVSVNNDIVTFVGLAP